MVMIMNNVANAILKKNTENVNCRLTNFKL